MTLYEYEEAKKLATEIANQLAAGNLAAEERQRLDMLHTHLTGALLSTWLPFDWGRRAVMIMLALVGAYGLAGGDYYFMLAWGLLPLFSPRAMGELAFAVGRWRSKDRT